MTGKHEFDPTDPSVAESGNPLLEYVKPPAGIGVVAGLQFVLAGSIVLAMVGAGESLRSWSAARWASLLVPAVFLCASGAGLAMRRGWGWWLTCAIYYTVFFNLPVEVALWTLRGTAFNLLTNLLVFGLAVVVLAYLTRRELLRFIAFRTADGKPTARIMITPVIAGLAWAVVGLIVRLV